MQTEAPESGTFHTWKGRTGWSVLRLAFVALGLFTVLRVIPIPGMDLMPQDAYYFLYAEHLALSYYDHPPLIGYLLRLAVEIFGKGEMAIRIATVGTTLFLQLLFWRLARRVFGRRSGDLALITWTALPMLAVLSLVATPDVPLLVFWTLSVLALHRALFDEGRSLGPWILAGMAMGLAFLSKYTAAFLPAGLLLFLVWSPSHRHRLRRLGPWIAILVSQLVSVQVHLWNLSHGMASFGFQLQERSSALGTPNLDDLGGFLLTQALSVLPIPLFLLLRRVLREIVPSRWHRLSERDRFLLAFSAPLLVTSLVLSPFLWVKLNWPMPAYVTGLLLVTPRLVRPLQLKLHLGFGLAIHAILVVQVLAYPIPVESNDTWFGWREIARRIEQRHAQHPGSFVFSTDGYKTTAELRFYSDLPEVYGLDVLDCPALQLELIAGDLSRLEGRDGLLVISEPSLEPSAHTRRALARTRRFFRKVEETPPIRILHRGELARLVRIFRARDYRGPGATAAADRRATDDPCAFHRPITPPMISKGNGNRHRQETE